MPASTNTTGVFVNEGLTPRQREVLDHLLAGLAEKEIAARMCLSPHTVHNHVRALYRALNVSSRFELFARRAAATRSDAPRRSGPTDPGFILEHAPDLIMSVDREGRITYANHSDDGTPDLVGTMMLDWVDVPEQELVRKAIIQVIESGSPCDFCASGTGTEGHRRYHTVLQPVRTGSEVTGIIASARDVGPA
ncbi:MAG: PAS domain-containing protein [Phycisphaerales bacterium]|nr:PAS domain-containing protein [Phycisphaerales bacterium]